MSIVRLLARPLVATGYIASGVEAYQKPSASAAKLESVLDQAEQAFPQLRAVTADRTQFAKGLAAAKVGAGSLLAIGLFPRLSAGVLLASSAVDTYAEYQAADTTTTESRTARRNNVLKDLSLVGALMIVSVDTAGNPSLAWRAGDLAGDVRKSAAKATADTKKKAAKASEDARKKVAQTSDDARKVFSSSSDDARKKASKAAKNARKKAASVTSDAKSMAEQFSEEAAERASKVSRTAKKKLNQAEHALQDVVDRF